MKKNKNNPAKDESQERSFGFSSEDSKDFRATMVQDEYGLTHIFLLPFDEFDEKVLTSLYVKNTGYYFNLQHKALFCDLILMPAPTTFVWQIRDGVSPKLRSEIGKDEMIAGLMATTEALQAERHIDKKAMSELRYSFDKKVFLDTNIRNMIQGIRPEKSVWKEKGLWIVIILGFALIVMVIILEHMGVIGVA